MADMTALAAIAREFSRAVEARVLTDKTFRRAIKKYLSESRNDRVLLGLGASEAGMRIRTGRPSPLRHANPALAPVISFMRAGLYANALRAIDPSGPPAVPADMRTPENFAAVDAIDGAFASMLKP